MTPVDFSKGPGLSKLLTAEEQFALIMNLNNPGCIPIPERLCQTQTPRDMSKYFLKISPS